MSNSRLPVFTQRFFNLRGGMTQAQFADLLGISRPSVSQYENGDRIPDGVLLKTIAEKSHVSADYLLGLRDDPTSDKDLQFIVDYTGLSSEAIQKLHEFSHLQGHESGVLENFNRFIVLFYSKFLHRLLVLKQDVEEAEKFEKIHQGSSEDPEKSQGAHAVEFDTRHEASALYETLKNSLSHFSDLCKGIPNCLFDCDRTYKELEILTMYKNGEYENTYDGLVDEFIKSGQY